MFLPRTVRKSRCLGRIVKLPPAPDCARAEGSALWRLMEEATIATITLARTVAEERGIIAALSALEGRPVIAADGGSPPRFIAKLHKLGAQIVCPKGKGLVAQAKASLRAALDASDAPRILYTEPDKKPFFLK